MLAPLSIFKKSREKKNTTRNIQRYELRKPRLGSTKSLTSKRCSDSEACGLLNTLHQQKMVGFPSFRDLILCYAPVLSLSFEPQHPQTTQMMPNPIPNLHQLRAPALHCHIRRGIVRRGGHARQRRAAWSKAKFITMPRGKKSLG